jgi:hypothetical protein
MNNAIITIRGKDYRVNSFSITISRYCGNAADTLHGGFASFTLSEQNDFDDLLFSDALDCAYTETDESGKVVKRYEFPGAAITSYSYLYRGKEEMKLGDTDVVELTFKTLKFNGRTVKIKAQ